MRKIGKIRRFYGSISMIIVGLLFKLMNIHALAVGLILGGVILQDDFPHFDDTQRTKRKRN